MTDTIIVQDIAQEPIEEVAEEVAEEMTAEEKQKEMRRAINRRYYQANRQVLLDKMQARRNAKYLLNPRIPGSKGRTRHIDKFPAESADVPTTV